jgi:hypothetical protein
VLQAFTDPFAANHGLLGHIFGWIGFIAVFGGMALVTVLRWRERHHSK